MRKFSENQLVKIIDHNALTALCNLYPKDADKLRGNLRIMNVFGSYFPDGKPVSLYLCHPVQQSFQAHEGYYFDDEQLERVEYLASE